jgi:hypothetical protein
MLETVPKSDVISSGDKIQVETDFDMKIEYKVPPRNISFYLECFPRKINPKMNSNL